MSDSGPIVTLTTDFGTADGYVGAMKGRILTLAPGARLVDISHDVPPQDVVQGAWCVRRAAPRFPPGTVHLVVIDPGVGSARAALVIETDHFLLVGPDNGVLSLAAGDDGIRRIIAVGEHPGRWAPSNSFAGLTLFAPVAAFLARGLPVQEVGPERSALRPLQGAEPTLLKERVLGEILLFDRFGNGVTNITPRHLGNAAAARIVFGPEREAQGVSHYAEGPPDQPLALWNSDGHLELALRGDSLERRLGLSRGTPVTVHLSALAGGRDQLPRP